MKVVDLADEIYRDLDNPTDLSIPQIVFWLISNAGQLNILIETNYVIVDSEYSPELGIQEKDILKQMYFVKFANGKINANLGAAAYDWSEIQEGDSLIRRVSKNEIAKNYKQFRDGYQQNLDNLVFFYKNNQIVPSSYDISLILINGGICNYRWI